MLWANCTDASRRYHLSGCSVEQPGHFYLSLSCFCSNFCLKSHPTNTHTFTQTNPNKKGGAALVLTPRIATPPLCRDRSIAYFFRNYSCWSVIRQRAKSAHHHQLCHRVLWLHYLKPVIPVTLKAKWLPPNKHTEASVVLSKRTQENLYPGVSAEPC